MAHDTMPKNVIQAIARVMEELPGIGRDSKSEQGYQYRGIEAITANAQTLMGKYCVVPIPKVLTRNTVAFNINNKPWTQEELEIEYTVYGPGGVKDCIKVGPLWGLGRDNSDKGANKAMTQAYKYALIQMLVVGDSKDDPDREVANQADGPNTQQVQGPAPLTPEQAIIAATWDSEQEFNMAHQLYTSSVSRLNQEQRANLRDWKASNKYPVWMQPHEYDDTMAAIRNLKQGKPLETKPLAEMNDEELGQTLKDALAPQTEETSQPPAETPEGPLSPADDLLKRIHASIDQMTGRECIDRLRELSLPVSGKVDDLRGRLHEHADKVASEDEAPTPEKENDSEQDGEKCQFCGENPCVCATDDEPEVPEEQPEPLPTPGDNYEESDEGRPFT